jgi:hypothetical protein
MKPAGNACSKGKGKAVALPLEESDGIDTDLDPDDFYNESKEG